MVESNNRVTLAVVQNEVRHTREDIQQLRQDIVGWRDDHEERIRSLEKKSIVRVITEFITAGVAAVGVVLGLRQS
jgi:hypothetical protein